MIVTTYTSTSQKIDRFNVTVIYLFVSIRSESYNLSTSHNVYNICSIKSVLYRSYIISEVR